MLFFGGVVSFWLSFFCLVWTNGFYMILGNAGLRVPSAHKCAYVCKGVYIYSYMYLSYVYSRVYFRVCARLCVCQSWLVDGFVCVDLPARNQVCKLLALAGCQWLFFGTRPGPTHHGLHRCDAMRCAQCMCQAVAATAIVIAVSLVVWHRRVCTFMDVFMYVCACVCTRARVRERVRVHVWCFGHARMCSITLGNIPVHAYVFIFVGLCFLCFCVCVVCVWCVVVWCVCVCGVWCLCM